MAGFDAMVSDGGADLTFVNNTGSALYICGKVNSSQGTVTFTVYGVPNAYRVERENSETREPFGVVEVVDPQKYPELVYTDQTKVVVNGSDGVRSQSFLCFYDGENLWKESCFAKTPTKRWTKWWHVAVWSVPVCKIRKTQRRKVEVVRCVCCNGAKRFRQKI